MQADQEYSLKKTPTGIEGFDAITYGGLASGRSALVCGSPGCGKTLFGMQFLVNGATKYDEPGVFVAFEESETELCENFRSLGINLHELILQKKLNIEYVYIDKSETTEAGEYDLEGLFVRLDYAIRSIGAKRVVLDTIEVLFSGLSNHATLRAELRRLFRWLKDHQVTTVITGEQGRGTFTQHGIEEYVSDCVILLDHRIIDNISTRRLSIKKYRGSAHGTNEYPFLIDEQGICIMPITAIELDYAASLERVSTGIERLDTMLGGKGYYVGSSILISGTAGTGKTTLAAKAVEAACRRGETCVYFSFEESKSQIVRNMQSIGIQLNEWIKQGLLDIVSVRPTFYGLEMHLVTMYKKIKDLAPSIVVIDPISDLMSIGNATDVKVMLTRLLDFLKSQQIISILLDLAKPNSIEQTNVGISSLADTWIALRDIEQNGERNRGLYVLKSRGMAHSNQIREFIISDEGLDLLDVYTGAEGVLTGTARFVQEAREKAELASREFELHKKQQMLARKRAKMETAIAELQNEFEEEKKELEYLIAREQKQESIFKEDEKRRLTLRQADKSSMENEGYEHAK